MRREHYLAGTPRGLVSAGAPPAVEQQAVAVVLERDAGEAEGAHGTQQMDEREGGIAVRQARGADVGDAVPFGVGGRRRRPPGEIGAHAVGRAEPRALADQHHRDVGGERGRHRVADRDPAVAHHRERRHAPALVPQPREDLGEERLRMRGDRARGQAVGDHESDVAAMTGIGGERR